MDHPNNLSRCPDRNSENTHICADTFALINVVHPDAPDASMRHGGGDQGGEEKYFRQLHVCTGGKISSLSDMSTPLCKLGSP